MFKSRCYNGGLQHHFEARYDDTPTLKSVKGMEGMDLNELLNSSRRHTYVCDICIWCGKTIEPKKV